MQDSLTGSYWFSTTASLTFSTFEDLLYDFANYSQGQQTLPTWCRIQWVPGLMWLSTSVLQSPGAPVDEYVDTRQYCLAGAYGCTSETLTGGWQPWDNWLLWSSLVPPDAGVEVTDAGSPLDAGSVTGPDAGSAPPDAGSPFDAGPATDLEAGSAPVDASVVAEDAGSPPLDAGSVVEDAGSPPPDSGSVAEDAGSSPHPGGPAGHDAGSLRVDGGGGTTEVAGAPDAGAPATEGRSASSGGCAVSKAETPPSAAFVAILFALGLLARHRRLGARRGSARYT
jgi:hypothetical protein